MMRLNKTFGLILVALATWPLSVLAQCTAVTPTANNGYSGGLVFLGTPIGVDNGWYRLSWFNFATGFNIGGATGSAQWFFSIASQSDVYLQVTDGFTIGDRFQVTVYHGSNLLGQVKTSDATQWEGTATTEQGDCAYGDSRMSKASIHLKKGYLYTIVIVPITIVTRTAGGYLFARASSTNIGGVTPDESIYKAVQ